MRDDLRDAPAGPVPLAASEPGIRLWLIDLDRQPAGHAELDILSDDERARAARFRFDVHRGRFIACRAAVRRVLAGELGVNQEVRPHAVAFKYGPFGKPSLACPTDVRFNVSHSDQWALVAVARGRELGIDIERVRALDDLDQLAATVFSRSEQDDLARVPAVVRAEAFFDGWTRKEAYIKARGDGLRRLTDFDVSLVPHEPVELRHVDGEPDETVRWSLSTLTPVPGFAAALCVERGNRCRTDAAA